jgi:stage III sporulation protein SpoIIIAA
MVQKLGNNRDILEQHLHHISAVRNRKSDIIGLAMRVGRYVVGNAGMISDLLFADPSKSILFVGEPGSGKTTILREISRVLSSQSNVCIIDTSNEIAGDGNAPHTSVGMARRLMVDSVDDQSNVMMQCLRSQKPDVMIVDELDRPAEVEAARTCKRRGVRMIAGAYGDLREIMHDQYLSELVGGVETTANNNKKKKAPCRVGPPIFDMIVELRRGAFNEWRIITDTADAVDTTLAEMPYPVQRRTRDPVSGSIHMEYEHL